MQYGISGGDISVCSCCSRPYVSCCSPAQHQNKEGTTQILKIVILLAVLLTLIGYINYSHRGQKMDRNERASRLPAPMTLSGGPGIQHVVVSGVMFERAEGAADVKHAR